MAKNNALMADKATGSAGNVTFANWKGIDYFKQKAVTVSNPNTDAQQSQRTRMRIMVLAYRSFAALLQLGFRELAVRMSAYNAFVKNNIESAVTLTTPTAGDIDYPALVVSKGSLGQTASTAASASAATDALTVSWNPGIVLSGQSSSDRMGAFAYNRVTEEYTVFLPTDNNRADGSDVISITGGVTSGDVIDFFFFFYSITSNKVSDSFYVEVTAGA